MLKKLADVISELEKFRKTGEKIMLQFNEKWKKVAQNPAQSAWHLSIWENLRKVDQVVNLEAFRKEQSDY